MHSNQTNKLIGRILATEKSPTTIDTFCFWTEQNQQLNAFDIVKVNHLDNSYTFGVIENISHITDASSFLTNFISSDFGDVNVQAPTFRIGMNYAEAKVTYNNKNIYIPVHNGAEVYLATSEEITYALGLADVKNPLVCGALTMYEGTPDEITLPVKLNANFLLGPEGAHMNISGISGLASKTSYAMFLMKAIQDRYVSIRETDESVAFVIFNVKGKDLLAIDQLNDFEGNEKERKMTLEMYRRIELSSEPFQKVKYFIPYYDPQTPKRSTYLDQKDIATYTKKGKLLKYKYLFKADKESIEMMFANVDDPLQTIDSIISRIIDDSDPDFKNLETWKHCLDKVGEKSQSGASKRGNKEDISVLSWRKFKRIFKKATQDAMFAETLDEKKGECHLCDSIKNIKPNEVFVIDIAKLPDDKQAFVFGDTMRTLYNLKQGVYDDDDITPPSRLVIFMDELNKYASKDVPKNSPILKQILNVTERGRRDGIILFSAEQFRSNIVDRVTGNCSTHAYGRTNSTETGNREYGSMPGTYKNILTRLVQGDYLIQNPLFRSLLKIHFPYPIYKQFKIGE